jgi:hypothetical protein
MRINFHLVPAFSYFFLILGDKITMNPQLFVSLQINSQKRYDYAKNVFLPHFMVSHADGFSAEAK